MVSKITYALAVSVMPFLVVSFFAMPVSAQEQKAMSMEDLLRQVEKGRVTDNRENSAWQRNTRTTGCPSDRSSAKCRHTRG